MERWFGSVPRVTLWLCGVNVGVFAVLGVIALLGHAGAVGAGWSERLIGGVQLPESLASLAGKPWALITYMFVQYNAIHLLVNMLWLWVFSGIVYRTTLNSVSVAWIYIIGGIAGGLAYIYLAAPGSPGLVGASAAVAALMGWTLAAIPTRKVGVALVGDVSMWVVVAVVVLIFMLGSANQSLGGLAAHLAGLAAGAICGGVWRIRGARVGARRDGVSGKANYASDRSLDDLLDKVRRSGYGSLSRAERNRLFQLSSQLNEKRGR